MAKISRYSQKGRGSSLFGASSCAVRFLFRTEPLKKAPATPALFSAFLPAAPPTAYPQTGQPFINLFGEPVVPH